MKEYGVNKIRNVCLLGHGGAGKTLPNLCFLMQKLATGLEALSMVIPLWTMIRGNQTSTHH